MKRLTIFLLVMLQVYSMQECDSHNRTGSPSKVPSLRLLAFRIVEKNLAGLAWKIDGYEWLIQEVLSAENPGKTIFERAQFVDKFKLIQYIPYIASDVAKFMDSRACIKNRKNDLLELQKLSSEMQRAIATYRKT